MDQPHNDGGPKPPIDDAQRQRIRARRERIAKKREQEQRQKQGLPAEEPKKEEDSTLNPKPVEGINRAKKGVETLKAMKTAGFEKVTHVQVASDHAEAQRRAKEDADRKERLLKLQEEQETSMKAFTEISKRWADADELKHMEELHQLLQEQSQACQAVFTSKDELAANLKQHLKACDDEYIRDLRAQASDIDALLSSMQEQINDMVKRFKVELEEIEDQFMQERQQLLETTRNEWQAAMDLRDSLESQFMDEARKRMEEQTQRLHDLHDSDTTQYNELRRKLEDEIERLQVQLQETKATNQLNGEKLDYNHHILKKREEENAVAMSQQKRRLNKLRDVLNELKKKIAQQERSLQAETMSLMEDYSRVVNQHQDLKIKARHFQKVDLDKYDAVYDMNAENLGNLSKKVLDADRCIHEQQLGLQWVPPVEEVFDPNVTEEQLESACSAAKIDNMREQGEEIDETSAPEAVSDKTLQRVLALLSNHGDFLLDEKLKNVLNTMTEQQQQLIRVDAILKSIEVQNDHDLRLLASAMISPAHEDDDEDDDDDDESSEPQLIPDDQVLEVLKEFVENQRKKKEQKQMRQGGAVKRRDLAYWDRLTRVLPISHRQSYGSLQEGFTKYHKVLQERSDLVEKNERLRHQNLELKQLLQQYMSSEESQKLMISPKDVLAHQLKMKQQEQQSQTSA